MAAAAASAGTVDPPGSKSTSRVARSLARELNPATPSTRPRAGPSVHKVEEILEEPLDAIDLVW